MKRVAATMVLALSLSACASLFPSYHSDALYVGMTKDAVKEFVGPPGEIIITGTNSKVSEEWKYFDNLEQTEVGLYVYFENGKVTSWKEAPSMVQQ